MWILVLSLTIIATAISWLIWFIVTLDCDFTLYYSSKFGRPICKFWKHYLFLCVYFYLFNVIYFYTFNWPNWLFCCNLFSASLKGKVVWITGASSGIGEALAYRLSLVGAKLIISGTNVQALECVKRKCVSLYPGSPDDILVLAFDITDFDSHKGHFASVIDHFGRLDMLINNAGRSQRALFKDIDLKVDKKLFDINVFSVINLTRIVVNYWLDKKIPGHLAVTSSTLGKIGLCNSSSYAGSKHALHGIFDAIRHEYFNNGIKVTIVCPGPVFSKAAERAFTHRMDDSFSMKHSPEAKRMKADRCAYLILVAISNFLDESWITFQPILMIYYATQYFPSISRWFILRLLTPDKMSQLREGGK